MKINFFLGPRGILPLPKSVTPVQSSQSQSQSVSPPEEGKNKEEKNKKTKTLPEMAALEDSERIRECFHDNVDCNNVGGRRNPRLIAVAAGSEMMMMKLNPLENHGTTTTTRTHLVHAVASCDGYHEKELPAAAATGQCSQNQLLLTSFMMALIILLFSVQALFFQRNSSSSLAAQNNNYQQQQQQQHFQVAYDHLSVDQVHGQNGGGKSAVRELPKNSAHEEVALIPCSGHGYMIQSNQLQQEEEEEEEVAADHIVSRGGRPRVSSADGVCKCHACYGGPDCSCQSVPECIIDLDQ